MRPHLGRGNDEPYHGVLPWCLPFGSGNPYRHGMMISEMRDLAAPALSKLCQGGGRGWPQWAANVPVKLGAAPNAALAAIAMMNLRAMVSFLCRMPPDPALPFMSARSQLSLNFRFTANSTM